MVIVDLNVESLRAQTFGDDVLPEIPIQKKNEVA